VSDTPSQAIKAAAAKTVDVTDSRGRVISIGTLNALEKLRMFEVVGAENAANQAYLGYATLAFLVNAIDGVPVARPTAKRELEALVARLDDDGLNAVGKHFADTQDFENPDKAADAIGAIKN
jgi:hypothetical protein